MDNPNVHEIACTLSSATAVNLAKGKDLLEAVKKGKTFRRSNKDQSWLRPWKWIS